MTSTLHIDAFYSDPHFGHEKVIGYCGRPFANAAEMDAELVRRYNVVVGHGDLVLWLCDCFWRASFERASSIMASLNGTKLLVAGNHDRSASWMARVGFASVVDELVLHLGGHTVRASHYPYAPAKPEDEHQSDVRFLDRRPRRIHGEALIHGHTHDKRRVNGTMIHVGVDAWDYAPVTSGEVEALVRRIFHHGDGT